MAVRAAFPADARGVLSRSELSLGLSLPEAIAGPKPGSCLAAFTRRGNFLLRVARHPHLEDAAVASGF
jgi:hypothetical protein